MPARLQYLLRNFSPRLSPGCRHTDSLRTNIFRSFQAIPTLHKAQDTCSVFLSITQLLMAILL